MNEHSPHPEFAVQAAEILLEIKAINFNLQNPFTLTSGLLSPVYVDCRRIISFPRARKAIIRMMVDLINSRQGFEAFHNIAGGESAGIPFGALVAHEMSLPMTYIRKKPKGHGRKSRIEGIINKGDRVLLVEDLATDGGSKINFVNAIREAGGICEDTIVVFYYGITTNSVNALEANSIKLHYLTNWEAVMQSPRINSLLTSEELSSVREFLINPKDWQKNLSNSA